MMGRDDGADFFSSVLTSFRRVSTQRRNLGVRIWRTATKTRVRGEKNLQGQNCISNVPPPRLAQEGGRRRELSA